MNNTERLLNKRKFVKTADGCVICISHRKNCGVGYPQITIDGKTQMLSRVIYEKYVGEIPEGLCVLHKCDNPECVNPDHLFLGTYADNSKDMCNKNRQFHPHGEKNGHAVLTEKQVIAIKKDSRKQKEIAKAYGISQTMISLIKNNKSWTGVRI